MYNVASAPRQAAAERRRKNFSSIIFRYRNDSRRIPTRHALFRTDPIVSSTDPQQIQLREWLAAVAHQDAVAFRLLYDETSSKLFGFALRILIKGELAEEVLQESYISIWNNAASYQPALAAPLTWMTTIVRNKAFDALRRAGASVDIDVETFDPAVLDALASSMPTPLEALQISGDAKSLAYCLKRLEGMHQQAIALAFYHDLSHSEVAEHLKLPIGTIKTWIRRGLERLRSCLSKLERT
jgi:RNA polymerase sigma factor (sigma-70 family)